MELPVTLVLGASPRPDRYSHLAIQRLRAHGLPVLAVGRRPGEVVGVPIQQAVPNGAQVDTVTLYINPFHQRSWYGDILNIGARRIVFNPGTENPELEAMARGRGIEVVHGCTLVMLAAGTW